jgi:hypothetical protein
VTDQSSPGPFPSGTIASSMPVHAPELAKAALTAPDRRFRWVVCIICQRSGRWVADTGAGDHDP